MLDTLFPTEKNVARYLPAVSHTYALAAADVEWQCAGIPGPMLDHLRRGGTFHYPACLVSYGQVARGGRVDMRRTMISERDRRTSFVVADSGGFQIQQGNLGEWRGDQTVLQSLRWMEKHADYVTALDFPTGGIANGNMRVHTERLLAAGEPIAAMCSANGRGLEFNACLRQTEINTSFMLSKRVKGPGFLVVLQGRNEPESAAWYQSMQPFLAEAEGVAFAGEHRTSYRLLLNRLINMRDDGVLARIKHIHVLGTGTMESGVLLTSTQRAIRKSINPDIQITYDTATPFQEANERYRVMTSYNIDKVACAQRFDYPTDAMIDDLGVTLNAWCVRTGILRRARQRENDRYSLFTATSGTGQLLKVSDLLEIKDIEGDELGRIEFKPDGDTALLMSAHNAQCYVDAQREAIFRFHHRHVARADERYGFPLETLIINTYIDAIFDSGNLHQLCVALSEKMSGEQAMIVENHSAVLPRGISGYERELGVEFIDENRRHLDALI